MGSQRNEMTFIFDTGSSVSCINIYHDALLILFNLISGFGFQQVNVLNATPQRDTSLRNQLTTNSFQNNRKA